jgi:predicted DNA-binding protein (MmcQ/YjbR family)
MSHPLAAPIRAFAAALPEAWEDHPWGDSVYKVGKKIFIFLGAPADGGFGVKLRDSHDEAMSFDWVKPSSYGLGRSGWVSCSPPADAPLDMMLAWIEESYRLVAPKRLAALPSEEPISD